MATKEPCELVVIPELNLSAVGKRWKPCCCAKAFRCFQAFRPGNRCKDNHSRLSRHCNPLLARGWGVGGLTCAHMKEIWRGYDGDLSIIGPIGSGELLFSSTNGPIAIDQWYPSVSVLSDVPRWCGHARQGHQGHQGKAPAAPKAPWLKQIGKQLSRIGQFWKVSGILQQFKFFKSQSLSIWSISWPRLTAQYCSADHGGSHRFRQKDEDLLLDVHPT